MASGDKRPNPPVELDGSGLRIGVVRAEWNSSVVDRLIAGVRRGLAMTSSSIVGPLSVPGCFELPLACRALALSGKVDAIVANGVVIRGETTHYELVSEAAASGIQSVQLETGIPIAFGVLTVESLEQALERSEGEGQHNVGEEAVLASVQMARLMEAHR